MQNPMGWWWQSRENPANSILAMKFRHLVVGIILYIKKTPIHPVPLGWIDLDSQSPSNSHVVPDLLHGFRTKTQKKEHPSGKYALQKHRKASCACRLRLHTFRCRILSKPAWIKLLSAPEKMKGFTMSSSTPVCSHRNNPRFLHATCGYPMRVWWPCTQQMAWGRPKFVPKKHHPHFKSPGLASFFFSFRSLSTCSLLYGLNVGWPCPPRFPRGDIMWYTRQTSTIAGWWF